MMASENQTGSTLPRQMAQLLAVIGESDVRAKIFALLGALVAVVVATAYAQIILNAWNQPFYDALARKDAGVFVDQLVVFAKIAGVMLVLNVAQAWLAQHTKIALRCAVADRLLSQWLAPLIAVRLSQAGEVGENPDQRIHEDVRHLAELTTDLGVGLLQSTLLLLTFAGVLWTLSGSLTLAMGDRVFAAPGYMLWCALLYSGLAALLSWRVGRPLIRLNENRYSEEAKLRSALVRVSEEIENITINGAESEAAGALKKLFDQVVAVMKRIAFATTGLTWVTAGVGWFAIVAPILIASPGYFRGDMTFGKLMMIVGAFNQVQGALGWFVNNFSAIADWRATLSRVVGFHGVLTRLQTVGEASRIEVEGGHEDSFVLTDLWIATAGGRKQLGDRHLVVQAGDRVAITGDAESERALFLAIAGLWPWGGGHIARPHRQSIVFMSRTGSVAPGRLRLSLTFPHPPNAYDDQTLRAALTAVGLERFAHAIDVEDRWDRRLSDDEKQRVAMARTLLVKPRWLVIHRALASFDPTSLARIADTFSNEMPDVGVIYIGDPPTPKFFTRAVDLATQDATAPGTSHAGVAPSMPETTRPPRSITL